MATAGLFHVRRSTTAEPRAARGPRKRKPIPTLALTGAIRRWTVECQLVNHVALVQLDSVDTEPMDACNALTAPSEGVRRERVDGVSVTQSHGLHVLTEHAH